MTKPRSRKRITSSDLTLSIKPKSHFKWEILILVVAFSMITGGLVKFYDNEHYNNSLLQSNNQATSAQSQLKAEQSDIGFIIEHDNGQINCYDLQSSYDRNICNSHSQLVR